MFDGKAFGEQMVDVVRSYVDRATAPLIARIAELEALSPVNGRDGADGAPGRDGADGNDGRDGVDGANGETGKDGRDGLDGDPGPSGRDGADGQPGADGRDGKDGVGLAGALIDRSGALVVTLSNGEARQLGPVVGRDGVDGRAGNDGTNGAAGSDGRDGVDGQNGTDGRDGADGLGFDDLGFEHDGERGFALVFTRGEQVKRFDFEVPVVLDRGVFRGDTAYAKGDAVTFGGSLWIAQADTTARPDGPETGWRLAVKKGRDGRNGADGERGPEGKQGPAGRDLTQLGLDGRKH